jgi:hypothetical protein
VGLFDQNPYSLAQEEKLPLLLSGLDELTLHHQEYCPPYAKLLKNLHLPLPPYTTRSDVPYLPVGVFKEQDLLSIPQSHLFKTLLSSGTTEGRPSKIYLDRQTAHLQTQALVSILTHFLGQKRRPLLLIESASVIQDPKQFSARGAGLVGMLQFGLDPFYLLDDAGQVKHALFFEWLDKHANTPLLIFGFTFMVWQKFIQEFAEAKLQLPQAFLFHSGGWKKMEANALTPHLFKQQLEEVFGIHHCHNFYGMVEQVGSIFVECEKGFLHTPLFADVVIRDPLCWEECSRGQEGIVEVLSLLPYSYPGHALLTEDRGILHYEDDCPCGRKGRAFEICGRVPQTQLRGCSDVY